MLKIRVTGLPGEVRDFVEDFKKKYRVLHDSKQYPNRNSEYVRVYLETKQTSKR